MGDSPDDAAVKRVEGELDPDATTRDDLQQSLAEYGIEGNSADAFADRMVTVEDVADAVDTSVGSGERDIATREDVQQALGDVNKPSSGARDDALVDETAREIGAPSESDLQAARGQALSRLDGDTLRSDPDLDPAASGGEGREIDVSGGLGKEGGVRTGVETRGDRGVYYAEDASGNRYPMAEVDL